MYDPARDIFTSSEDAAAESVEPGARRDSSTADAAKETPNDAVMNPEASNIPLPSVLSHAYSDLTSLVSLR
jgi:hypothetical protein